MKKLFKKQKGITLIALVVTIVVLLILAGVSINLVLERNGIIEKTKSAKKQTEQGKTNEEIGLNEITKYMENIDPETGWNLDKVNKITSEDNVVVPVPKGYVASTVEGEKSVSTGFVIKEGNDGSKTEGINEFVWVPVNNISDIYDEANNAGQLWNFSGTTSTKITYPTTQNSGSSEPDVVTGTSEGSDSTSGTEYDAVSTNLQQAGLPETATASDFKAQLQTEFNEMINSVKTYGGFYIGRYETGNLSTAKAVVQKNNSDIDSQTWYTMYKVCKTIKTNENVTTSMIWGCQWDATLRWMQTSSNSEVANFPTNSEGKGNYLGTQGDTDIKIILTGSNLAYAVNNIYDMAGNEFEWTIESRYMSGMDGNARVGRGGVCVGTASDLPVSIRGGSYPTISSKGIRVQSHTLYKVTPNTGDSSFRSETETLGTLSLVKISA